MSSSKKKWFPEEPKTVNDEEWLPWKLIQLWLQSNSNLMIIECHYTGMQNSFSDKIQLCAIDAIFVVSHSIAMQFIQEYVFYQALDFSCALAAAATLSQNAVACQ